MAENSESKLYLPLNKFQMAKKGISSSPGLEEKGGKEVVFDGVHT